MSTQVSIEQIKRVRKQTSAGVMEVKHALEESGGDEEAAKKLLSEWGAARAESKLGREVSQGQVYSYIHGDGRMGVLLEVNCETDFVAKTGDFQKLCKELALQVASMNPQNVEELLGQEYVRDGSRRVEELVKEVGGKTGENIKVKRFVRYELGE